MKAKRRAKVASIARDAAVEAVTQPDAPFHVLSIRFSDGKGIDLPYKPWMPRQSIDLPGRWVRDDDA